MSEVLLGKSDEIREGEVRRVTVDDIDFCVARVEGSITVIEDRCPHSSAPMSFGEIEGTVIVCPLHRARFDLKDFSMLSGPAQNQLNAANQAQQAQQLDPEQAARAARRREMMAAIRIKPLVVYEAVQRNGDVYAIVP
jgi:nitrite reductase (NADH) small subunit